MCVRRVDWFDRVGYSVNRSRRSRWRRGGDCCRGRSGQISDDSVEHGRQSTSSTTVAVDRQKCELILIRYQVRSCARESRKILWPEIRATYAGRVCRFCRPRNKVKPTSVDLSGRAVSLSSGRRHHQRPTSTRDERTDPGPAVQQTAAASTTYSQVSNWSSSGQTFLAHDVT